MARSDIKRGASQTMEELERSDPDFMRLAREAVSDWTDHSGENYLLTAIAKKLKQAYQLGLQRSPIPAPEEPAAPAPTRRSRPAPVVHVEPDAPVRVVRRRTSH